MPKPQGYFRISLADKGYTTYTGACPYSFEYANDAVIGKDSTPNAEPCWINIDYPKLKARIYISYKPVTNNIATLLEDTRTMVYKHTVKADDIEEKAFTNPETHTYGNMYEIGGNAASSVQFFVTDSTRHFVRGALYFNCSPNADSLAPVIEHIKKDVVRMMETMVWK